jgi:hypothetical protein
MLDPKFLDLPSFPVFLELPLFPLLHFPMPISLSLLNFQPNFRLDILKSIKFLSLNISPSLIVMCLLDTGDDAGDDLDLAVLEILLELGCGAGFLEGDFDALGVD